VDIGHDTDKYNEPVMGSTRPKGEPKKDSLTLIEAAIPVAGDNQMLLTSP
jgi:hypothetical protein